MVKKQRMVLEIEKNKLREEIAELDDLKSMLEEKKKDTHTGFDELAESNKELRSMKSGDLYRERSMNMFSRASQRSKQLRYTTAPGYAQLEDGSVVNHQTIDNRTPMDTINESRSRT